MKYISTTLAVLLVGLFFFNANSVLDYEENLEVQASPQETEIYEEGSIWEDTDNMLNTGLKSIQDVAITGDLGTNNISFSEPVIDVEGDQPKDENENKKIFFFGKVEPEVGNGIDGDSWGEWEDSSYVPTNNPETNNPPLPTEDTNMPIEVTFDRFLEGN